METLVATVLIVIIFMVSSMVLNNIVHENRRSNTQRIENHLGQLHYEWRHGAISVPHEERFMDWDISMSNKSKGRQSLLEIEAVQESTGKRLTKTIIHAE